MEDIVGKRFGKLVVIGRDHSFKHPKYTKWICKCDCGNEKSINRNSLVQGRTKSCGCESHKGKKGINRTHGMSNTRIFGIWEKMRQRCKNQNDKYYSQYGGRGISVCMEWDSSFEKFYQWSVDNGYSDNLSIERIDVNGNYCPENCSWIPMSEQPRNRTNTIRVFYNGKEWCLRTLCGHLGFPYRSAYRRYSRWKKAGKVFSTKDLFAPIETKKIAFRCRHQ